MTKQLLALAVGFLLLGGCTSSAPTTMTRFSPPSLATPEPSPAVTPPDNDDEQTIGRLGGQAIRDRADPAKPIVELNLNGASATDSTLKKLAASKGLRGLEALYLINRHGVTDAGLKEIAHWTHLQRLNLEGTAVTDAGVKELRGLNDLRELNLIGTDVTDKGLKELAGLKQLHKLNLFGTKATADGVKELQKALPNCKIRHETP